MAITSFDVVKANAFIGSSWLTQGLQWGRDQLIAETTHPSGKSSCSGGFNGAAIN